MFKSKLIFAILISTLFSLGGQVYARDLQQITDWYIKNFQTEIVANKDSSLLITENITADCGNLPDKHGIFRVIPTQVKTDQGTFKTPIELVSITDFNGNPYKYQTIIERGIVTWKIGDPKITVSGENDYRIIYKVKSAIRFVNSDFDELYWNIMGNYWDIETDNFSAKITFPPEITPSNSEISYYTGLLGSKDTSLALYSWGNDNSLNFVSVGSVFEPREGITVSVIFPKGIFIPYQPTFLEKYADYFWSLSFLITIAIFFSAFSVWKKYGKDPKMPKSIPPEFGIPNNITPMQMGMVIRNGSWKNELITATIIDLAVRKFITIKEIDNKILFLNFKDYELIKAENYKNIDTLTPTEKILLEKLFNIEYVSISSALNMITGKEESSTVQGKDSVKLSDLKNNFYASLPPIEKSALVDAESKWITKKGLTLRITFVLIGILTIILSGWLLVFSVIPFLSFLMSGIMLIIFGFIMPKRTQEGVDLLFEIKGFELYMKTAETYRQQFYEKENIFDKLLPYAIVFGIADLWAKKMRQIYGEDYFKNYHPVWFVGGSYTSFDVNSFTSQLNSITQSISQSTSSSSGAHGSGGAGGGGGGGGGGGW